MASTLLAAFMLEMAALGLLKVEELTVSVEPLSVLVTVSCVATSFAPFIVLRMHSWNQWDLVFASMVGSLFALLSSLSVYSFHVLGKVSGWLTPSSSNEIFLPLIIVLITVVTTILVRNSLSEVFRASVNMESELNFTMSFVIASLSFPASYLLFKAYPSVIQLTKVLSGGEALMNWGVLCFTTSLIALGLAQHSAIHHSFIRRNPYGAGMALLSIALGWVVSML
jgi:hypothetical protein